LAPPCARLCNPMELTRMHANSLTLNFANPLEAAVLLEALAAGYRQVAGMMKIPLRGGAPVRNTADQVGAVDPVNDAGETGEGEADDGETGGEAPTAGQKQRRRRRTNAEIAADNARAAAEAAAAGGQTAQPAETTAAPTAPAADAKPADYLITELRATGDALLKAKGGPAVGAVLVKYGAKKYPECPVDKREAMLADLKAELAKPVAAAA
jgi:hypothetical protein